MIVFIIIIIIVIFILLYRKIKCNKYLNDFVLINSIIPDVILDMRYYSDFNFVGKRIDGYEDECAILTKEACYALKRVSDDLRKKGYRLKIFDAYRPKRAVVNFVNWSRNLNDTSMKKYFYPNVDKSLLLSKGFIAEESSHSRGSTVDLTLYDIKDEKDVDMGGHFDYFDEISHSNYEDITPLQKNNRMLLRNTMIAHGFKPLDEEWWHFTLENEPFPNTYFDFPVSYKYLKK